MDKDLQSRAEQVLLDMLNKAADIGEAAVNEIPLAVQELLKWKMAESIIENLIALLIALSMLWLYRKAYDVYKDKDLGNHPEIACLAFTAVAWIPVPFLINFDWLKIWIAPRVYLLEYAAALVG